MLVSVLRMLTVTSNPAGTGGVKFQGVPKGTVWSGLQLRVGSKLVTVWLQMAVLPHWSVACQVRVAVTWFPDPLVTVLTTATVRPWSAASNLAAKLIGWSRSLLWIQ